MPPEARSTSRQIRQRLCLLPSLRPHEVGPAQLSFRRPNVKYPRCDVLTPGGSRNLTSVFADDATIY